MTAVQKVRKTLGGNILPCTVQIGLNCTWAKFERNPSPPSLYLQELRLLALYCRQEEVLAVATLGWDPVAAKFANFLKAGNVLKRDEALEWCKNQI